MMDIDKIKSMLIEAGFANDGVTFSTRNTDEVLRLFEIYDEGKWKRIMPEHKTLSEEDMYITCIAGQEESILLSTRDGYLQDGRYRDQPTHYQELPKLPKEL